MIHISVHHQFANSDFALNVEANIPAQGVTAIFGHSGSGKTTLLRLIAGLEPCQSGLIQINDQIWMDDQHNLPTHKRSLGYVFQESSLLPHLTVEKNLNYGIKRCLKKPQENFYQKVLNVLGIKDLLNNMSQHLSGGERQRVAMARALLIQPDILLMDEPLASLDGPRKQEILPYLESLHQEFQIPILYVSHSVDEVARLADHILVLENGKLIHQGSVKDTFANLSLPLSDKTDTSIIIQGQIVEKDREWHLSRVLFEGGELWVRDNGDDFNHPVRIRILAKDVSLALENTRDSSILNKLPATVEAILDDHDSAMGLVKLTVGQQTVYARLTRKSIHLLQLKAGLPVWAQIKSVAIVN